MVYTIKPRSDVYCFKLIFNISNVGYYVADLVSLLQYFTGETLHNEKCTCKRSLLMRLTELWSQGTSWRLSSHLWT